MDVVHRKLNFQSLCAVVATVSNKTFCGGGGGGHMLSE